MGSVADGRGTTMITLMLAVLGAWFLSLFAGPAIYAAMGLAGFAFLALAGVAGIVIPQKVAMAANSFPLLAAPLFILMGNLMNARASATASSTSRRRSSAGCAADSARRTSSAA